jgi:DNA polymerase
MTKDTVIAVNVLDENTRRYYLDVMGIQCWQSLDVENQQSDNVMSQAVQVATDKIQNNMEVASGQAKSNVTDWPQLESSVLQCNRCQLHKTRKQAIAGRGNQSAELMFVLLSPDMNDDESGVLCDGEANELFAKMLTAINISIKDVYITSLLKCAVPAHHTISPDELHRCNDYLQQQIQLIQPKLLVVLGETAVRCMLQKDSSLDELRESINVSIKTGASTSSQYESVPLFVSYSARELLQQPENKRKAWLDLQQIQKIIQT